MDLWIYDENFKRLGVVDTAESIIWANRFRQCGDFEIYIPASAEMLELLQEDRFVGREDDDMVCIIEKVVITTDEENGDYLTVTGRDLRSILERRIVWNQTSLNGTVEKALQQLVRDAFIDPEIPERQYNKLRFAAAHNYTETVSAQYTGTNLLEAIMELCAAYNYGFKIFLQDGYMRLDFYKGVDRSANQEENTRVIFSEYYDNLKTFTYTRDKTNYKSVVVVAGEGEGLARKRVNLTRSVDTSGLHRREMYIDARDISSNEGEISDSDYNNLLAERGSTSMSEAAIVESMSGSVEFSEMYTYGKDYNLGDIVTTVNKYGLQVDSQVLEVVEVWDENGYECTPTFG